MSISKWFGRWLASWLGLYGEPVVPPSGSGNCIPISLATRGRITGRGIQPLALATFGRLVLPAVPVVVAQQFETLSGPGKLDPYSDPFRWQHHREDDEIMAIISSFLSMK